MNEITALHRQAMACADGGFTAKRQGDAEAARKWFKAAMEREAQAARMCPDVEPSRAVLFRSAAALAVECGEFEQAEELIAAAFEGNPPRLIADELMELRERMK